MGKYIVKRILQVIPMLFILSLIVFMMVRLIPGDPVDMMLGMDIPKDTKEYERERLGLNDPLYIQYFRFVGNALHGDLGTSIFSGKPVVEELAKRFPKTLTLAVGGTLFGAAVGVLLGIIAAIHRNKFADNLIMVLSLLTVSTPSFFLALILMLIFCLNLRWLPSIGMDTWQGAVLPIATLGLQAIGSIARTTRSAMLDVIHQDYIRTSRSRGVPERVITYRHAFKNALIPVLTTIGLRFGGLLAGATLVDTAGYLSAIVDAAKNAQTTQAVEFNGSSEDLKLNVVYGAAHGTKCFTSGAVATAGDTIVLSYIDEFQFAGSDAGVVGVPNSDSDFGAGYAEGKVLMSKRVNADYYSKMMAEKAGSTVSLDANYDAIQNHVNGMSIADAEALSKDEKAVDAVSGATLVDTAGYVGVLVDAAK